MVEVLEFAEFREQTLQMVDWNGVVQIAHINLLLLFVHFSSGSLNCAFDVDGERAKFG